MSKKKSQEEVSKPVKKDKNPGGRPTKYTEDMPTRLLAFFDRPLDREVEKQVATNKGVEIIKEIKPNRLPTVEGFCAQLKISKRTFHDWVKRYDEFSHALGAAKQMQIQHLLHHGLEGGYNSAFAKFVAVNISDYREKVETVNTNKNIEVKIDKDDSDL